MKFSKDSFFKSNRLGLHLGPVKNQSEVDYKLTCPFARSWIAILIAAAIAAIFSVSGYSVLENEREPFYSRIILMHVTIIIGGGLSLILGEGALALSLLIIMKIIVDVKAHLELHSGKQAKKA